ncbi:MAG: twin-arginine translocation signal domain-containing protein, partial [Bacteroidetes bacterium]|nr:twin-arginine translocation signal domain-containing protein [Bacteroidota bacterium]
MKPNHDNQNRRTFLRKSALAGALTIMGVGGWPRNEGRAGQRRDMPQGSNSQVSGGQELNAQVSGGQDSAPAVALSTWRFGLKANAAAWTVLNKGGKSLDAVEAGVRVV